VHQPRDLVIMAQPNVPAIRQNGKLRFGHHPGDMKRGRSGAEAVVLRGVQQISKSGTDLRLLKSLRGSKKLQWRFRLGRPKGQRDHCITQRR
jgi:hypothetical protein